MSWKNLAPGLVRQRVVIEATSDHVIQENEICAYPEKLSSVLCMRQLRKPFDVAKAVEFSRQYFHASEIVWKEFEV